MIAADTLLRQSIRLNDSIPLIDGTLSDDLADVQFCEEVDVIPVPLDPAEVVAEELRRILFDLFCKSNYDVLSPQENRIRPKNSNRCFIKNNLN